MITYANESVTIAFDPGKGQLFATANGRLLDAWRPESLETRALVRESRQWIVKRYWK